MAADETHPADLARTGVKDRAELRALTSVRGVAAWFVVLYHIRFSIAGLPPAWRASSGGSSLPHAGA